MIVRYCRRCDEEFQPHIVRCSDCGGELEDQYPDSATVEDQARIEDGAAESEFETVARDLSARKAELVARRLGDAGIPFRVAAQSYGQGFGFVLSVRKQDEPATRQILGRARALPRSAPEDEPAVGEAGGPCPACGDPVAAGAKECSGCGLSLGSEEAGICDRCGAELVPPWEPCKQCGRGHGDAS